MVELMVALGIISIGVFALAAGSTLMTRLSGGATIQSRVAVAAATRLERLRGLSCTSLASGADTNRAVVSTWTTQAITNGSTQRGVSVLLTVQYPTVLGSRTQTYRTVVTC